MSDGIIIGIDTGGTFTDVTILDRRNGVIRTAKISHDAARPVARLCPCREGRAGGDASRTGRSVSRAARHHSCHQFDSRGQRSAGGDAGDLRFSFRTGNWPPGYPAFRQPVRVGQAETSGAAQADLEIPGRIDHLGNEIQPLDETAVREAARAIAAAGITAVAVVFIHCYANPEHERRAGELIAAEHPSALVSLSSDVLPVFREYERAMTTVLNVYVMPAISTYVGQLEQRLTEQDIAAPLLLMKSSGGVTSARTVRRTPVETVLSGPAAGAVGANFIGQSAGFSDIIGIDIGGTSADICLIHHGQPGMTMAGKIAEWPVGRPMLDITTIGAGGGSIARVSPDGALTVGPHSAGAVPGPVCYGKGGTEPTVTDAHLVLGHLPPYLLDGSFHLDIEAARGAIAGNIAEPLGMSIEEAARGIISIVDHT